MSRRRVVALASAAALLLLGLVAGVLLLAVTQTELGQGIVRDVVQRELAARVRGRLYVGRISGGLLTGVRVDSLEIRDPSDSLFIASGPIELEYDPRDLIDRRILLRHVRVERPQVVIKREQDGQWNYRRVFPSRPRRPRAPGRGLGDYVVIDSATVLGGSFRLTLPWRPADSLRGARRDSAVRANLARTDAQIRPDGDGWSRSYTWTAIDAISPGIRLSDPDSSGRLFRVARLDVVEHDPPFRVRDLRGEVRVLGDSVWLDVPHFRLPGSVGSGEGKIWWGSRLPVRYDIRVRGDSVALADVAWVYETLPRTGGGSMRLHIRNAPDDLRTIDYALSELDVRTTGSRLRGAMTYGVGGPVLEVKDVDLRLEPVDLELLEVLGGGPFPYDWRGTLTGMVRGRGGPLDRFRVDSAALVFRDANVPGAIARGSGRGELDIRRPALAVFRNFALRLDHLDLRTPQAVNPEFPRLAGIVSGRAVLDSVWVDVRFRDADALHVDPATGERSRVTGRGRVTLAEPFIVYDLDLVMEPVSFTGLASSYPGVPLRGSYAGPLRARGTLEDLELHTELAGPAGTLAFEGRVDGLPPVMGAQGTLALGGVNLPVLLDRPEAPASSLTLRSAFAISGSGAADLAGAVAVDVDSSSVGALAVAPSTLRARLNEGYLLLDTLRLRTPVGLLEADGALGLVAERRDSVRYTLQVDSLGGLRPWLPVEPADTLAGRLDVQGVVVGSTAGVDVTGRVAGTGLRAGTLRAARLNGDLSVADALGTARGSTRVTLDTLSVGGVLLRRLEVGAEGDARRARVRLATASATGPVLVAGAEVRADSTALLVTLDTLEATAGTERWALARPATLVRDTAGMRLDSLDVRGSGGGSLGMAGAVPVAGAMDVRARVDALPLGFLGLLAQSDVALGGTATFAARATGTREAPLLQLSGSLDGARFGDARLARVLADVRYADRRLRARASLAQGDSVLLRADATLPLDLAFAPRARRRLDEPLTGTIRSERMDLSVVEAFTPLVREARGDFLVNVDLGGTLAAPRLRGAVQVHDGTARLPALGGVRVEQLRADLAFADDSLAVRRFDATTRVDRRSGLLSLTGGIGFADPRAPVFDLSLVARDFHAIAEPRIADLEVSTAPALRLTGPLTASTLTGGIRVERGTIYMPPLTRKRVIDLDDPEFFNLVDTTIQANRALLPSPPPALLRGLTLRDVGVELGDEVWLRGPEANINLTGRLNLATTRVGRGDPELERPRLALDGMLTATRGTYRLNLNVVQRTFEIEQGTLRFFGDAEFNPGLDISAIHTVRPYDADVARQDVRIRATITGTLAEPRLGLESADNLALSESDLLSYLVTGGPSFAVGGRRSDDLVAARLALSSLGSYLGSRATGGFFDVVQVQTSGVGEGSLENARSLGAGILAGTRLGLGVQISDRAFVSADAGLCQLGNVVGGQAFNATDFASSIGVKVDYRLSGALSLSVGVEPSTSQRFCRADQGARGFAPTPRQFTFDLERTWRF